MSTRKSRKPRLPFRTARGAAEGIPQADSGLGVALERGDGRVRITVVGQLDLTTADAFAERVAELEAERAEVLEIDLRGLAFMDSSGLAQLFEANRRARQASRRVVILKAPGAIDRVLALARVEDVIDVVEEPAG